MVNTMYRLTYHAVPYNMIDDIFKRCRTIYPFFSLIIGNKYAGSQKFR
jgi:hypothetical protein